MCAAHGESLSIKQVDNECDRKSCSLFGRLILLLWIAKSDGRSELGDPADAGRAMNCTTTNRRLLQLIDCELVSYEFKI